MTPWERALAAVQGRCKATPAVRLASTARVVVHFHPDRDFGGRSLLSVFAGDGVYRSQFETGTSNGGLTAHAGGARFAWEHRIFGGAYDAAPAQARPKYGALLEPMEQGPSYGAAPRFGSAYLRLHPEVLARTTFCRPDSVFEPEHFGVAQNVAALVTATVPSDDPLDHYTEAHVHGPLLFATDVEALVLDPCFAGTTVEREARALAPVEWHPGYRLAVSVLARHEDYRGPDVVALGHRLATGAEGTLTPRELGLDAKAHDPQLLKRLWHCVARFGKR